MTGMLVMAFLMLLAINGVLWLLLLPIWTDKRLRAFQEDLVNRHYDEVETMYRKMRGWRHDYHNHIQVLKAYLSMGQYEEAKRYLEELRQDLTTVDTVFKTGNLMMDAILNSKIARMREKEIQVDAAAYVPNRLPIPDIDLAVLVGNLLDNAMEACEKLPPQERFVRIYADILKGQFYLAVTNAMKGRESKLGISFYTTKQGSHGYGLWRVRSIVAKYGGFLNQKSEEGVFATEVSIPLPMGEPKER